MTELFSFYMREPTLDSYWRSIILLGSNSACYKFSLGETLLEFAQKGITNISADTLSEPYAKRICKHLMICDRQGTSSTSRLLNDCRLYNQNDISIDKLIDSTKKLGFENVLDAFHIVNREETGIRFFEKKNGNHNGIILTDNIFRLVEQANTDTLSLEVNARWRLVETSWELSMPSTLLCVEYDSVTQGFDIVHSDIRRKDVTSARDSLNGYQKGKCFYCHDDLQINMEHKNCHVDHVIPFTLQKYTDINLNGIWNLVLACPNCNGSMGKWRYLPHIKFMELLELRNNYFIHSKHPLGETIFLQTGNTKERRHRFLQAIYSFASSYIPQIWEPEQKAELII